MPIPVTISANGFGLPVRQVTSGAPTMQVTQGLGIPIVLSDLGVPFVVLGGGDMPLTPDDFTLYANRDTSPVPEGGEITALTTEGTSPQTFTTSGTGAAPTKEENAIRFNIGRNLIADGITFPAGDGFIMVVDFTANTVTGTQELLRLGEGTGQLVIMRQATTNAQIFVGTGINGTTQSINADTLTAGKRTVLVAEFDRVAGTVRYWNANTQAVVAQSLAYSAPALNVTRIMMGVNANASIHEVAIVGRPAGQAWPVTFDQVLDSYDLAAPLPPEPITFSAMRMHVPTGQSLYLGRNDGGQFSPSGARWRDVLSSTSVRMLLGHRRKDAVAVTHIAAPLLQGYNTAVSATSDRDGYAASNVPPAFVAAYALAREGLPAGTGISLQFHGAGGQSVVNLDSSAAEGDTVIPWENLTFSVAQQAAYWQGKGVPVNCPVFGYCQGEADISQPRNWWLTRFTTLYNEAVTTIRAATGQTSGPRLYLFQTGGYMQKNGAHLVVLDQLDAIRNLNGILVAPLYWQKINNDDARGVHMGTQGNLQMGELEAWAITETEAGRAWNLMPPVSVERSGDTITIPITVRSDESLTTSPGKYADYGGDPANLGLEVDGGGSITSASVSGGNIVLQVSGTVTAVRYAMQTTGIDYRTLTDANQEGYATHRGIIRTTLTRTRTVGGLALTMERAVPTFSVAVTEEPEPEPSGFTDDFNRADQQLEASPNWELISGTAGTGQVVSNWMVGSGTASVTACYRSPDMGTQDQAVQFSLRSNGAGPYVMCRLTALLTGVGIRLAGNLLTVWKLVNGSFTLIGEYNVTYVAGMVIRMEVVGTGFRVAVNGARVTSTFGSETIPGTDLPASTRQGLSFRTTEMVLDDYSTEAITAFTIT